MLLLLAAGKFPIAAGNLIRKVSSKHVGNNYIEEDKYGSVPLGK
jgi:hypothetical protein